ncbi:MAG: hypothetical protein MK237_10200 [Gemmatimonadetes bacterium]|nr:hypothetical protein [Gemmatimonadota bacterium]
MHFRADESGRRAGTWLHLVPLGDHRFATGRYRGDRLEEIDSFARVMRCVMEDGQATGLEWLVEGQVRLSATRIR